MSSPYLQIIQSTYLQPFIDDVGGIFAVLHDEKDCEIADNDWHVIMFNKLFTWWFVKTPIPPNLTSLKNDPYKMHIAKEYQNFRKSNKSKRKFHEIDITEQDNQIKKTCSDLLMELHIIEKFKYSIELTKDEDIFVKSKKLILDSDMNIHGCNYTLGCGFVNAYKYLKKIGIPLDDLEINLSKASETTNQEIINLLFNEIEEQKADPEELLTYICERDVGMFMLKALLTKFNLELSDENKGDLLENSHMDVLEWLVADQSIDIDEGQSAMARHIFEGDNIQLVKWYEDKFGFDNYEFKVRDAIFCSCGCNYDIFKYLINKYGLFDEYFQTQCVIRILVKITYRETEKFLTHFSNSIKLAALREILVDNSNKNRMKDFIINKLSILIDNTEFKKYILLHYKEVIYVCEEFAEFWNSILQSIKSNRFIDK